MAFFENLWASRVSAAVQGRWGLEFEDLSESQHQTLKMLALSMKDLGYSRDKTVNEIIRMADEEGGLIEMLGGGFNW